MSRDIGEYSPKLGDTVEISTTNGFLFTGTYAGHDSAQYDTIAITNGVRTTPVSGSARRDSFVIALAHIVTMSVIARVAVAKT